MAKAMKDVTGDGKFTYADVLKMRGVKLKKQGYGGKVMQEGGRPPRMEEMASIIPYLKVGGGHRYPIEFEKQITRIQDAFDAGNISASQRDNMIEEAGKVFFNEVKTPSGVSGTIVDNPSKRAAMEGRGLMEKGGTVDYFAGGALAAGLGQLAQRSQNPFLQKAGKVASMIGGLTPGGKAVNMAGNVLQNVIPPAGAQPTQQGVRDTQAVDQAAPQQGGGLMSFLQSPVAQNLMNQFIGKQGMVVPNAKVRLLKLER